MAMDDRFSKGPVAWMTRNSVASNLLMFILLVGGFLVMTRVKQEVFPDYDLDIVRVSVVYPGASPEEIEEGVLLSIEDEVRSLDGVKRVTSVAFEGNGVVNIELLLGVNQINVLQDVKNVVDSIQSFPEEAERPIVSLVDRRREVVTIMVTGDVDRRTLKDLSEEIRDELIQGEGVTLIEVGGVPSLEISIEIPSETLRAYNLKLEQVSDLVRRTALDLPGGGVKAPGGEVLLRTQEKRDFAREYEDIPVISNKDGTRVLLGDIADIDEKFEETYEEAYFNGKPAVYLNVFRVGDQSPLDIAERVTKYVRKKNEILPPNVRLVTWDDRSELYWGRIQLLMKNAILGLALVLLFLGLFLEPYLAFWVTLGIPVSIIGSFLFIPWTSASINMISLFAFIVTLGIIVDDAILVGENIYHKREKGLPFLKASILGAQEMTGPVTFAVLTNIMAFLPLFFVPGPSGKLFMQIPSIVVSVFIISLIESLFVLPSHLSHEHKKGKIWRLLNKPNKVFESKLKYFIDHYFVPQMTVAMSWRYLTMTCAIGILAVVLGIVLGGHLDFSYLPKVESDVVTAQVVLPYGVPLEKSREVQKKLVEAGEKALAYFKDENASKGIYTQIGEALEGGGGGSGSVELTGSHLVGAQMYLVDAEKRTVNGVELANKWREEVGEVVGAESTSFQGVIQVGSGKPIEVQLSHPSNAILERAAKELADELRVFSGVFDIDDGVAKGKQQLSFHLRPEARGLGITTRDLAEQVRGAFYGAEALRQQRGRDEIKVMIRLPESERQSIETIEELVIRTPQGGEIPISEAAEVTHDHAYTNIDRTNGRRVQAVTADVDETVGNAVKIMSNLKEEALPQLMEKYPGLTYTFEGEQRDRIESLEALGAGFIFALFGIYALLAIPFKSYAQPVIVMLSIPFGVIGAVIGHMLLGYELSIISMFGIVALSGVVVNDSLVLVVTANENVAEGMSAMEAIIDAGRRRFRPIILTSFTTFFGLAPMIFERSMQARFLIPMAVSLGFGILFSTFIILLVTTSFYLILEDIKSSWDQQRGTTGTK